MTETMVLELGRNALIITLMLALPLLLSSLLVGLIVSLVQAVTQIHEVTLTFVPKLLVFFLVLALLGSWMLQDLLQYTAGLFTSLPNLAR
ncbi:MAG: flagellar biosynthesis protein FliQ [Anaerolineae bacterium]|nr:flagellar biosynthesis protein FliQ [Anaerolineae bacterium]MDW8099692.1 flagellar biosynthesis protein FliQ [Anaerolineae bacterium]